MKRAKMCRLYQALPALTLLGLLLLAPGAARGQNGYKIRSIITQEDPIGDPPIKAGIFLSVGTLNDAGQIVFVSGVGGRASPVSIVHYSSGKFTPVAVEGQVSPVGRNWSLEFYEPVSMDQAGNLVFTGKIVPRAREPGQGTFLWDYQTQKVTAVALVGMPAVNNLTFADWTHVVGPGINDRNEIVLATRVRDTAGAVQRAIFLLGQDRTLLPVVLPNQALPGGGQSVGAERPSLNNAGVVAFVARRMGEPADSGYLWERGTITPLMAIEADAPGGGKIASVEHVWVNNKNRSVLVHARVARDNVRLEALYRLAEGKLHPVVVVGQEMAGGGRFKRLQDGSAVVGPPGVSFANDAGEHAILAELEDGSTAAYRMDEEGKLSLILKSGTATEVGTVTRVGGRYALGGGGIGLNNQGQVAFTVHAAGDGGLDREMLVLLTPTAQ